MLSNKERHWTTLAEHNHRVGVCVAKAVIGVPYWQSGFRRRGARRLDRGRRHGRGHLLHGRHRHCRKCLHGRRRGGRAFARSTGRQGNRRRDDPCDDPTAKHRSHSHNSALRPMFHCTATRRWHLTGGIIHFQGSDGSLSPDPDLDPAEPGVNEPLAHEDAPLLSAHPGPPHRRSANRLA